MSTQLATLEAEAMKLPLRIAFYWLIMSSQACAGKMR